MNQTNFPALLVVTNAHEAKWFAVEETGVTFLAEHFDPKATFSDKEGGTERGGAHSSQGGATDLGNQEKAEETRLHLANTATMTAAEWKKAEYARLVVAVPEYLKNQAQEQLAKAIPGVDYKSIFGNYTRESTDKLFVLAKDSFAPVLK